jgi:hypothetical protein
LPDNEVLPGVSHRHSGNIRQYRQKDLVKIRASASALAEYVNAAGFTTSNIEDLRWRKKTA